MLFELFRFRGDSRPLATAMADHVDAYKQLPLVGEDELSAVVKLQRPGSRFILQTQLFGPAAAGQHYTCVPTVIASLPRRFPRLPYVGYYDDFGLLAPTLLVHSPLKTFTNFKGCLEIILQKNKSEAGSRLEFLGLTISFRGDHPDIVPSKRETRRLASVAPPQKLAGKLRLAQTVKMGRCGEAALKPIYSLVAAGGERENTA